MRFYEGYGSAVKGSGLVRGTGVCVGRVGDRVVKAKGFALSKEGDASF